MAGDRIVLIGVGNEYRRDDGVALAVLGELTAAGVEADRIALCDGEPTRLIDLWDGAALAVVVDAVHAHPGRPGRVHRLRARADAPVPEGPGAGSHGLGLGEAVALARILDRLPEELLVVAVEGADFGIGQGLSPAVAAAVPRAADLVREALAAHRAGPGRG
ncbi:hydrogenase maturation protease [Kitasatospora sp. NPDC058965]|uniref:hydrogenase maturation protease n=1 Tax=Kitasatospora sp. NPDC058965 TaxID=3346682 RepID=UPI0036AE5349